MADLDLLGVGGGVIKPGWVGKQQLRHAKNKEKVSQLAQAGDTASRDARLINEAAIEFNSKVIAYSQTVDLASVPANTTANRTITVTTTDRVRAGDYVLFAGASSLEHGILIQGGFPAPANDTIQIRVSNVTGGAIDPASQTMYFLLFRDVED